MMFLCELSNGSERRVEWLAEVSARAGILIKLAGNSDWWTVLKVGNAGYTDEQVRNLGTQTAKVLPEIEFK